MLNTQMTREIEEAVQRTCSLLVFRLSEQAFALNIENVVQIIPMLRLTPVPQIDHTIEGIANIHGALVPVISVRRHLGLPDLRPGLYTPIILTRVGERQVGWIVDEVSDVISVPAESIIVPANILPEGMENSPVMSGLVYLDDCSVLVLDPRYILRPSQFRKLNRAFPANAQPVRSYAPYEPEEDCDTPQASSPDRAALEIVRAALAQKQSELQAEKQAAAAPRPAPRYEPPAAPEAQKVVAAPAVEAVPAPKNGAAAHEVSLPVVKEVPEPAAVEITQPAAEETKQPEVVDTNAPAAAQASQPETEAENQPAAPEAESPKNGSKPRKRGSKKGKIIPNTAFSLRDLKGRDINAVLAEQFAALENEVIETDKESGDKTDGPED